MKPHKFRSFQAGKKMVGELMSQHNHSAAYRAALVLVQQFPTTVEAYFLLNLAVCLSNRGGGAWHAQGIINDARERCGKDFDRWIEGDMQRDRALGLIRHCVTDDDLNRAEGLIQTVRRLHAGDRNREVCTLDVQGRLHFARGEYLKAIDAHASADRGWKRIGTEADEAWKYYNLIGWLKAIVMAHGSNAGMALWLERKIREEVPEGRPSRAREAFLIRRAPAQLGPKAHDWLLRHYV